jgi:hypothetical protein
LTVDRMIGTSNARELDRDRRLAHQLVPVHRLDRLHLHRLVVDQQEGGVLRGNELIGDRVHWSWVLPFIGGWTGSGT